MSDNSLSDNDENDLTIDSTTFGIPQNSHRSHQSKSAAETKSIISSSVGTNHTNFLSAKESFDSLDTQSSHPEETTSHFTSPTKSTISLFGTDVLAFFSPSSTKVEEEDQDTMSKTVAKGTMPASEEEPHFDAATQ